jgi:hypothetical protein|tara:strand:- start:558 stop:1679 length:1122 start_codon:yes stop_codon:yes gene_type:complete
MPIGNRFSIAPNTETLHPIGLVGCEACGLIQLKHEVSSGLLFGGLLSQSIQSPKKLIELDYQVRNKYKLALYIGGLSDPPSLDSNQHSTIVVALAPFILASADEHKNIAPLSYNSLISEAVNRFLENAGPVDEVLIDNSTKEAHPFHASNVNNIDEYFSDIVRLIKPDGRISLRCPDITTILQNGHVNYIYHEHQVYFCSSSIKKIMEGKGFQIVSASIGIDHVNSCFTFGRQKGKDSGVGETRAVGKMKKNRCGQEPARFQEFASKIQTSREKILANLNRQAQGRAVGYGASVAGISSLYQFGLEERVDLLVDDAEKRVGMYSPHSNHKVFSSRELKSLDVQTTLILVPRYTDSIIARWSGLLGNVMPVGRV